MAHWLETHVVSIVWHLLARLSLPFAPRQKGADDQRDLKNSFLAVRRCSWGDPVSFSCSILVHDSRAVLLVSTREWDGLPSLLPGYFILINCKKQHKVFVLSRTASKASIVPFPAASVPLRVRATRAVQVLSSQVVGGIGHSALSQASIQECLTG